MARSEEVRRWLRKRVGSLWELLLAVHDEEGENSFGLVSNLMWQIWKARCRHIFEEAGVHIGSLLANSEQGYHDYKTANARANPPPGSPSWPVKWQKPTGGFIKCNVDASLMGNAAGLGLLFRDAAGVCGYASSVPATKVGDVEFLELCAIHEGLKAAFILGYSHVLMETDSLLAYRRLQSKDEDLFVHGSMVEDILALALCFYNVSFSFVKREGNVPAHLLSRLGATVVNTSTWTHDFPVAVGQAILADLT